METNRSPDLEDDDVLWLTIPRWAYWAGVFALAGLAYYLLH